jgi:RimJ/RimL family protein N-acetyltransferase
MPKAARAHTPVTDGRRIASAVAIVLDALTTEPTTMRQTPESNEKGWHRPVPILRNAAATLREISTADARALLPHLTDPDLAQHELRCPRSLTGVRRFARWARERRRRGRLICFVIVPAGQEAPVGLLQLWPIDPGGAAAEFSVIVGRSFWGGELFQAAAALMFQFAFGSLGVKRLESRTIVANRRANHAMRKVGATPEATLRPGNAHPASDSRGVLWSISRTSAKATSARARLRVVKRKGTG